jgi:hypothetical protein
MTRVAEWVLGIVGGIAAFLGLFILFGGEDQHLGIGGDLTWRVGDIASGWGYGLLIGGAALLVVTVALVARELRHPHEHGLRSEFAGLMTHLAIFVLVNALLWTQDIAAGGGLEYAYWVTIPWGIGLLAHIIAYVVDSLRRTREPGDERRQGRPRAIHHHH